MSRADLSVYDYDQLLAAHAARTALLRAMHPLRRPALDTTERDSEIRVAMGALAIVVLIAAGLALTAIGATVFVAFGSLATAVPASAAHLVRWVAALTTQQRGLIGLTLTTLGLCALFVIAAAVTGDRRTT